MKLDLNELMSITQQLIDAFSANNGRVIDIDKDYYWSIDVAALYNPYEEPRDLSLGQLSEDWNSLKSAVSSQTIIPYDLNRLGIILKALSDCNPI
jgi:hypothetical protein